MAPARIAGIDYDRLRTRRVHPEREWRRGQGEAVRVPLADGTLVPVPGSGHSDETMVSFLTLSDVMGTGEHAAVCARVKTGDTVAELATALWASAACSPPSAAARNGSSRSAATPTASD